MLSSDALLPLRAHVTILRRSRLALLPVDPLVDTILRRSILDLFPGAPPFVALQVIGVEHGESTAFI